MRKEASSSIGYLMIFGVFLIAGIIIAFVLVKGRVFTNQRSVDDTLTDACLAALVMDDDYYFISRENGKPILRFKDHDSAYNSYKEVILDAKDNNEQFYKGLELQEFIEYEVYEDHIEVTSYDAKGNRFGSNHALGSVITPTGEKVLKTSCYGRIGLTVDGIDEIENPTTKDCYCVMKFKEED